MGLGMIVVLDDNSNGGTDTDWRIILSVISNNYTTTIHAMRHVFFVSAFVLYIIHQNGCRRRRRRCRCQL